MRVLDEINAVQPRRSLRLEVQNNNANGSIYEVILFSKAGFWRDKENKTGPPPNGYRIYNDSHYPLLRSLSLQVSKHNNEVQIYNVILFGEPVFWSDERNKNGSPTNGY